MTYTLNTRISSYQTEGDLAETFDKWRVRDYEVDYNVLRSRHGNRNLTPSDRAVTVRWIDPKTRREIVLSMDRQQTVNDNLRVLYLAIEAMRMNEKRGIGEVMQAAYLQLQAPSDHWQVLGLAPGADRGAIEAAYREQARRSHPDMGGSDEQMAAVNAARDAAIKEINR